MPPTAGGTDAVQEGSTDPLPLGQPVHESPRGDCRSTRSEWTYFETSFEMCCEGGHV